MDSVLELLRCSLGTCDKLSRAPSDQEWEKIYACAQEQTVVGVLTRGLETIPNNQRPPEPVLLQWLGMTQLIVQRNKVMNEAVVNLSKELTKNGIRHVVVKGQTIAYFYPYPILRQSGDVDFIVHQSDWGKAITWLKGLEIESYENNNSLRHIEWVKKGVIYEMHRRLTSFSCGRHQMFWERTVMPEVWKAPRIIEINGYGVPTLPPSINCVYIFVHIFEHFFKEGIGLRQICDWYYVIDKENDKLSKPLIERYLKGSGLYNAFCGMGALLTDYLGMEESRFPFIIDARNHQKSSALMRRILEVGNFGQNIKYKHKRGLFNGARRIAFIIKQSYHFGFYAPEEAWGALHQTIKWWRIKITRRVVKS